MSEPNLIIPDSVLVELRMLEKTYSKIRSPEFKLKGGLDLDKVKKATENMNRHPNLCDQDEMLAFVIDMHHRFS
ncbi:hypothetical protein SteCoe_8499 [Stentor coeruleus]|uniref:Uncharacterized protein n=1 Tax=Stentor coeruleus TaxID=5963 RepID=A0A1R2CK26_9CILI|nr:hypothetical protein SteCoe_8499 [Stentor coeruleus]